MIVKKAFSLIEIIFTIAIISIILVVALPKMNTTLQSANINKIKSDLLLIREALNNYKNKMILKGISVPLDTLEDNDEYLFNTILQNPIKASTKQKIGSWSKVSQTTYKVYIENDNNVEFIYNSDDYSFNCDEDNPFCQELIN